ncbi:MAG: hypothetical protein K2X53_00435 [Alphaproteobacteria bacterium]|nr:hypothetical protein [Alphaproteobacteria bacterium]
MHVSKFLTANILAFMLSSSVAHATNSFGADNEYDEALAKGISPKTISLGVLKSIIGAEDSSDEGEDLVSTVINKTKRSEKEASEQFSISGEEKIESEPLKKKFKPLESIQDPSLVSQILPVNTLDRIDNFNPIQITSILPLSFRNVSNSNTSNLISFSYSSSSTTTTVNGQIVESSAEVRESLVRNGVGSFKHILSDQRNNGTVPQSKLLISSGQNLKPDHLTKAFDLSSRSYEIQPFIQGESPFIRALGTSAPSLFPSLVNTGTSTNPLSSLFAITSPTASSTPGNRGSQAPQTILDLLNGRKN